MKTLLAAGIVLLLLLSIWTGVSEIQPGERAVIRRLGRVLDEKPGPGLWVGLPWGIDRVDRVPVDLVRRVHIGYRPQASGEYPQTPPGQLLSGDHNLVNVQVALVYSVIEDQVEQYVVQADRADSLIARAAETALAEWVAGRTVDEVLLQGKTRLPSWIARATEERIMPYGLGVRIGGQASVTLLTPPEEVKPAFDAVTRAQTEIRTNNYRAEQEAQRLIRDAEAEKFRSEQMTAAYVREQRVLAQADAESFEKRLQQYHRFRGENPAFLSSIWWDEMGKLFAQMKENGRLDLMDNHLGGDGLDITVMPPAPKKK